MGIKAVIPPASRCAVFLWVLINASRVFAQSAPVSPDRLWRSPKEQQTAVDAQPFLRSRFGIDLGRTYTLAELIDFAEAHNPLTRVAWENARAQAAALGIARSELYPTLAAVALAGVNRIEVPFGSQFFRQTIPAFQATLELNYTVFDFGARAGRIAAAAAEGLAANFSFNDAHRRVINTVQQAYYRVLNTSGQEQAARASLANAQTVQQSAEERLKNGLATLPDVLEARSATAQAQYDLQAILGAEAIARGDLATALGLLPTSMIRVQPLDELKIPESIGGEVDRAISRTFEQRPDLLAQVAGIRAADARVKEARAAFYPNLTVNSRATAESLYVLQQTLPWAHRADLVGGLNVSLNWTVFDGGERRSRLEQAQANVRAAEAQFSVSRDQIADEVWAAYSNLNTALRQREAALALLTAATQSYAASLESYRLGVRNLLDVTAAQKTLAQARSADVLARTQVLATLADLAFRTGDSIQPGARR
jgi:outer membrane protein TolC